MDKTLRNILLAMLAVCAVGFTALSWEWLAAKNHQTAYFRNGATN